MPARFSGFSTGNLLRRPKTGSVLGLAVVFLFFTACGGTNFASPTSAASWQNLAAQLGFVAIPIGLLMIAGKLASRSGRSFRRGQCPVPSFQPTASCPSFLAWAPRCCWGHILHLSPWGNGTLATGGKVLAYNSGIPTERMTVLLFVCPGMSAAFVRLSRAMPYNSAQVSAGQSDIFNSIISVVVGVAPTAAPGVMQATHVLRFMNEARKRGLAVIFVTRQVMHAMVVGDHCVVLTRGSVAPDFRKRDKTRKKNTDLTAGGASMANLEAGIGGLA